MGADRTLVAAAGKMAPAKVDYSGVMSAIGAVGNLIAVKTNLANQLISERPDGIDISELPEEMREANMDYFEEGKKRYNTAVKAMKFSAPFTKKYKNAVAEINAVKKGFEKTKSGLVSYADYREKVFTTHTTQSLQANTNDKNHFANLVINEGKMNSSVVFSDDGLQFKDDSGNLTSIDDLPNIYSGTVGVKAAKMAQQIIEKRGGKLKINGGVFDESATLDEFTTLVDTLHSEGGWKAVKSLAYDGKFSGRSFMQSIGDDLKFDIDDDFGSEYNGKTVNEALKIYQEKTTATQDQINKMQDSMLADAWDVDQNDILRNKLVDHLYNLAEKDYMDKDYVSPEDKMTDKNYSMPNGTWKPKENVNIDVNRLNSGEEFSSQLSWNNIDYKHENGVYSYWSVNNDEWVPTDRNGIARALQVQSGPYGYKNFDKPFGSPGSIVKGYEPFDGGDGQMVDGDLIIFSAVDPKTGEVSVRDNSSGRIYKVILEDIRPVL